MHLLLTEYTAMLQENQYVRYIFLLHTKSFIILLGKNVSTKQMKNNISSCSRIDNIIYESVEIDLKK